MSATTLTPYPLDALPLPALSGETYPLAPAKRRSRWIFTILISVVCSVFFLLFAFYAVVVWVLTHPQVARLASDPMTARNLPYDDVTFASADGLVQVHGWWIPAGSSDRTVVLSHGYGANREESWVPMYDIASLLHGLQYNVLMFDYGYADSSGRLPATGGVTESEQLLGALRFARAQGSRELVVWGFSMGAGTALQTALKTDLIDGMILDSTFIPDADSIYYNLKRYVSLPKSLSIELLSRLVPMFAGTRLEDIPSSEAMSTSFGYPVLVIYGTADDKSPASISESVAAAQTNPLSQLWTVPGAIHEMIFRTHPEEYVRRTSEFLQTIHENALALKQAQIA